MLRYVRKATTTSDSLVITIPKYIVEQLQLKDNQEVDVEMRGQKIIIDTNANKE